MTVLIVSALALSLLVFWLAFRRPPQASIMGTTIEPGDLHGEHDSETEIEMVDSGSFECFLAGMSESDYQANSLFQQYHRLKLQNRTQEARDVIREILQRYPNSKAARLINQKRQK